MSDYPDADEEFELMYGDELELLRDQDEGEIYEPASKKSNPNSELTNKSGQKSQNSVNNSLSLFSTQNESQNVEDFSLEPSQYCASSSATSAQLENHIQDSSKKRTADDLFGDIGDIDFGDEIDIQPNKKIKSDKDEELLELMEHIILLRKLNKEKKNLLSINKTSSIDYDRDKHNISRRVPKYPFVGITCHDGEKIYVRFHSEEYEKEEIKKIAADSLEKDILGESSKKIWEEAQILLSKHLTAQYEETDVEMVEECNSNKELWTDLYRPRKYVELLSDESTNRIMLKWLKLWDKAVFNRRPKIRELQHSTDQNKSKFTRNYELDTNLDEHGRPQYKVALLCGPPGLGKTTLAHVAAKHAGYNVVEVNASDDRSTEAFKIHLENSTQMKSVVDQKCRPNCLVFDEIDGAPQSSIDFLIKYITGTNKSKKGKNFVLKRPIICICNDVYVPALKPLRQIAFVIHFPPTCSTRLAERLMSICRREQIKTDLGTMMALAEKSNNDIRSCLSVLHFFKSQNKLVTLSDVYKFNIGQKDMQKGLFTVWQEIFNMVRPKINPLVHQTDTVHKQTMRDRMSKILQTVSSFGDYERVAQGVYENMMVLQLKDSSLQGISQALDWFVFSDILNKQIYSLQNYTLGSYLPYAFVVWHFLFATWKSQKLNYPNMGYEMRQKETRRRAIVTEVLRGMLPSVRAYCHRLSVLLDILPLLTIIIVPNFRPVNLHLYTKEEKDNMLRVVKIMIDYNLNYIQERLPDGNYVFNLEPNIDEVVFLEKDLSSKKKVVTYSNKQLIAREIELEKMRRFEQPKTNLVKKVNETRKDDVVDQVPNHLQSLKAKSMKIAKEVVAKDFFGRIIGKSSNTKGKTGPELNNDIWYQYKEGYNNAVRKRIKMSDIL
ncbi:chromosome transmission fidelity protein 18 homolog isoform X1 [Diorhabda sublineata]|uniref:chromosome transmission fidelity protein 18 homolog isoform X1 n=1 Tax=Diorhabda sublineata TaxID=1163346 RepID=UPI0024E114E0|nr:chromosome transmission fidelity protein 18 homolog isoform X1 [Diorhabda sublineata]